MSRSLKERLKPLVGLSLLGLVVFLGIVIVSTAQDSQESPAIPWEDEISIPPPDRALASAAARPVRTARPRATADPHATAWLPLRSAGEYWQIQRRALARVDSAIARHRAGQIQEAADLFVEAAIDFQDAQFEFGQAAHHNGKPWARGLHGTNGALGVLMMEIATELRLGRPITDLVHMADAFLDDLELYLVDMMQDS